ncbi:pilus assembly protein [Pengzhenrongella frigida]|uniref:Pilus assembly protein n=1 Tax=Pengzhenrongella frigida TaxID=1259133 RepID=A0A4Q5MVH9_9MICO|nr:pilus assembly protein [Cellulomonas sp. HLT2-17]
MVRTRPRPRTGPADAGSAVLEFLALTLLLLVPIVYLVLVLGRLQAATFAAEGAAREAGRAFTTAAGPDDGARRAVAAVHLALADQGFEEVDAAGALGLECSTVPCLEPGSSVLVRVVLDVDLPYVPEFVRSVVPLSVPVSAEHVAPVDRFAEAG